MILGTGKVDWGITNLPISNADIANFKLTSFLMFNAAPLLSKTVTTSTCPLSQAIWSGEYLEYFPFMKQ
jgi:hypothetical protein